MSRNDVLNNAGMTICIVEVESSVTGFWRIIPCFEANCPRAPDQVGNWVEIASIACIQTRNLRQLLA